MATKLSILRRDLDRAAKGTGKNSAACKFLVDITAGYALAHHKIVQEIEALPAAVENVSLDIDFTPRVSEAIKHLPVVSEQYYTSLVRLGIVEQSIEPAATDAVPVSDKDALAQLYKKVDGK